MNMLQTIVPKSDQLNADDLIGQSLTIKVTDVRFKNGDDQPVSIHFDGDAGKPYKPCKSMRRVLVHAWGADAKNYIGRSMSLCRDPKVQWGGQAVGGIRITHLSDINESLTMALTATRGSRKPYTVNVLAVTHPPTVQEYEQCSSQAAFDSLEQRRGSVWKSLKADHQKPLKAASDAAKARLSNPTSFDSAVAIATIKQASEDLNSLEHAWSAICTQCDQQCIEIPNDVHAAYTFAKESFNQ